MLYPIELLGQNRGAILTSFLDFVMPQPHCVTRSEDWNSPKKPYDHRQLPSSFRPQSWHDLFSSFTISR